MLFKDDHKLTIITISDFLNTTIKREIKITRTVNGRAAYVVKGKRKEYYFNLKPDMLVFDGWSLPITVDTDTNQFNGDGCYNFLIKNSVQVLKAFLITKNLNKAFAGWRDVHYELENLRGDDANRLFTDNELTQLTNGN